MSRRDSKHIGSIALAAMAGVSLFALQANAQTSPSGNPPVSPTPTAARPLTPLWNDIHPLWNDIHPLWNDIHPLWNDIHPLWNDIHPLSSDANPFTTTSAGANSVGSGAPNRAFWGALTGYTDAKGKSNGAEVGAYWKDAGSRWEEVMAVWAEAQSAGSVSKYGEVGAKIDDVIRKAGEFWGAAYQARAGTSVTSGLLNPLKARYGITSDPNSLSTLSKSQQIMFFLELYDGLMGVTGADHVDHWMATSRWSPKLTQTQGAGADTVIGLLDFTVLNGSIVQNNIVSYGGASRFTNGHGAAVAGLMVGAHDGVGVMGISPRSRVVAYNPFDQTGAAGWEDVAAGLKMLTANKASVINMSLGVAGSVLPSGWNDVFSRADVSPGARNALFVISAGNEGISQTGDVSWNFATNPQVLIVGSVSPDGKISSFSNRPGTACLTDGGACKPGQRLMDRFLVAPGEYILVEDDKGGVKRASGTSFSAPLVTGAASLIQDRWPWFAAKPAETAEILLRSARDLGAPGTDPVYGVGLLDITAAQSPLDFGSLKWYTVSNSGQMTENSVKKVLQDLDSETGKGLQSIGLYYYAFETIGSVERDFGIPLSSRLVGQTFTTKAGATKYLQDYILGQLTDWAKTQTRSFHRTDLGFGPGDHAVANPWGADLTLTLAPRGARSGFVAEGVETQSRLHLSTDGASADFGFGDGARYLAAPSSRAPTSDFDPAMGGGAPLLGLASGGAFLGYQARLTDRLDLTAGVTQRRDRRDESAGTAVVQPGSAAEVYSARAATLGLRYAVSEQVSLRGAYVRLREDAAILGVQSLDRSDLGAGAASEAVTLGLDADLGAGLNLSVSGSVGRTRADDGFLRTDGDGVKTSAWQATLSASDLFADGDSARLSILQPLYIEKGRMAFTGVEVVNRLTGDKGVVSRAFDVRQERPVAGAVAYGRRLAFGQSEVSVFGRAELNPTYTSDPTVYLTGARFRIGF
ncbi:MAG: S8 family serine peptidase [Phenylobacterium sp.]